MDNKNGKVSKFDDSFVSDGIDYNKDALLSAGRKAASWMSSLMASDGSFTTILTISGKKNSKYDWIRSVLSGWALGLFGQTFKEKKYILNSERNFLFNKKFILDNTININCKNYIFSLTYLGEQALVLNHINDAISCAENIIINRKIIPRDPIVLSQISSFFGVLVLNGNATYLKWALRLADLCKRDFDSPSNSVNSRSLARYAGLFNAFFILYKCTGNKVFLQKSKDVAIWLLRNRLESGAFKNTEKDTFVYSRGTAKVLECLSIFNHMSKSEKSLLGNFDAYIVHSFNWLINMQYNSKNTFSVDSDSASKFYGGFRHDYFNADAWIDAAGHFLVAVSRYCEIDNIYVRNSNGHLYDIIPLKDAPHIMIKDHEIREQFQNKRFIIESRVSDIILWATKELNFIRFLRIRFNLSAMDLALENFEYLLKILVKNHILKAQDLKNMLHYKFYDDSPGFYSCDPELQLDKNRTDGNIGHGYICHGFSKNWNVAMGQAFGEIFERYFNSLYKWRDLAKFSVSALAKNAENFLNPRSLARFSDEQKEHSSGRYWNGDSIFNWVKGERYFTSEAVWLPAQTVFYNYVTETNEPRLRESNTSGLGSGPRKEEALLSALYEVIERDAFFAHWLSGEAPCRIDPETIDDEIFQEKYQEAKKLGFEIFILNATADTKIPVMLALINDERGSGGPSYILGGACKADPIAAVNRALDEAWSIYYGSRTRNKGKYDSLPDNYEPFKTPINIGKRISIWSNPSMKKSMDFFIRSDKEDLAKLKFGYPKKFKNKKEELDFAVRTVESLGMGYEVYNYFAQNRILKKIGFHSVRVVVPCLIPMYYNEKNAPLELGNRLKHFADYIRKPSRNKVNNKTMHIYP